MSCFNINKACLDIHTLVKSISRLERMSITKHDSYSKGDRVNAYKTRESIFVVSIYKVKNKEKVFP